MVRHRSRCRRDLLTDVLPCVVRVHEAEWVRELLPLREQREPDASARPVTSRDFRCTEAWHEGTTLRLFLRRRPRQDQRLPLLPKHGMRAQRCVFSFSRKYVGTETFHEIRLLRDSETRL